MGFASELIGRIRSPLRFLSPLRTNITFETMTGRPLQEEVRPDLFSANVRQSVISDRPSFFRNLSIAAISTGLCLGLADSAYAHEAINYHPIIGTISDTWSYLMGHPVVTSLGAALLAKFVPISNFYLRSAVRTIPLAAAAGFQFGLTGLSMFTGAYSGLFALSCYLRTHLPQESETARISEKMPWLRFNSPDGDIPETGGVKTQRYLSELAFTMSDMFHSKIPGALAILGREFGWLTDPDRASAIAGARSTQAWTLLYSLFCVGGAYAVMASPFVDTTSKILAILLLAGQGAVRIPTSFSYSGCLATALDSDGNDFYNFSEEEREAFVRNTPLTVVHYFAGEPDVYLRSAWGSFLVERPNGSHVWGIGEGASLNIPEVKAQAREILDWTLDIREGLVMPAQQAFEASFAASTTDIGEESRRLADVLADISGRYCEQAEHWYDLSSEKHDARDAATALDQYLADQWTAHANRISARAQSFGSGTALTASGQSPTDVIRQEYSYLASRYDYDIFNLFRGLDCRIPETFYTQMHDRTVQTVPPALLDSVIADAGTATTILNAVEATLLSAGKQNAMFFSPSPPYRSLKGKLEKHAVDNHLTGRELIGIALFDYTIQNPLSVWLKSADGTYSPPTVGAKTFLQGMVYDHFGTTCVQFSTPNGQSMEMPPSVWATLSQNLFTQQETAEIAALTDQISGRVAALDPPLTPESARNIVDEVVAATEADPANRTCLQRDLRDIERTFLGNGGTGEDLLQALAENRVLSKRGLSVNWFRFPSPTGVLSDDKDYIPKSINVDDLGLSDIFRNIGPVSARLVSRGRITISVIQSRQAYAFDLHISFVDRIAHLDQVVWYGAMVPSEEVMRIIMSTVKRLQDRPNQEIIDEINRQLSGE